MPKSGRQGIRYRAKIGHVDKDVYFVLMTDQAINYLVEMPQRQVEVTGSHIYLTAIVSHPYNAKGARPAKVSYLSYEQFKTKFKIIIHLSITALHLIMEGNIVHVKSFRIKRENYVKAAIDSQPNTNLVSSGPGIKL
jgi:hypothetical protein